jgi:hypothetical protein
VVLVSGAHHSVVISRHADSYVCVWQGCGIISATPSQHILACICQLCIVRSFSRGRGHSTPPPTVGGDHVAGFQGVQDMFGIILSGVLHCEVINDEAECDWPCVMSPHAGCVFAGCVP